MDFLHHILLRSFLLALFWGGISAAVIGVGMLFYLQQTIKLNSYLSRWIDTGRFGVELDRPRGVERCFYINHRFTGAILSLGSAFVLYSFLLTPVLRKVSVFLTEDAMGILDAVTAILITGNGMALLFGTMVIAKPSLIRRLEVAANRWISTDMVLAFFQSCVLVD
jgi:hypothetical protein